MTKPDSKRSSVTGRKQSRLDATLGFQNVSYDVARCQLKYTSRLELFFFDFYKCINNFQLIFEFHRKALKSLQDVGGVFSLVVPSDEVQFPGYLVGHFTGGETLRAVLPKEKKAQQKGNVLAADKNVLEGSHGGESQNAIGYGVQLTWCVAEGKHNGMLDVRVCWHDIVYLAHVDFAKKVLVY
jgi:hypothetical protein